MVRRRLAASSPGVGKGAALPGSRLIVGFLGLYYTDRVSSGAIQTIRIGTPPAKESEAEFRFKSDSESVWFQPKATPADGGRLKMNAPSCGGREPGGNQEPVKQRNISIHQCHNTLRRRILRGLSVYHRQLRSESSITRGIDEPNLLFPLFLLSPLLALTSARRSKIVRYWNFYRANTFRDPKTVWFRDTAHIVEQPTPRAA